MEAGYTASRPSAHQYISLFLSSITVEWVLSDSDFVVCTGSCVVDSRASRVAADSSFSLAGLHARSGFRFSLGGQWMAWRNLAAHGFFIATSPRSSFIYVLTATHALHLLGGLAVLLYTSTISPSNKSVESRRIVVDVTAWNWHLMLVLWIYVFGFLWIAR